MRIINLWGAPGTGKSTIAAGLFYRMKAAGFNVELVTEYAKDVVWDEHTTLLKDQLFILAKQNRKLERLRGKVDWCISDSPLLLSHAYVSDEYYSNFKLISFEVWSSYININYLLTRDHAYQNVGRVHSEGESLIIDDKIYQILEQYKQPYINISTKNAVEDIFCDIDVGYFDDIIMGYDKHRV